MSAAALAALAVLVAGLALRPGPPPRELDRAPAVAGREAVRPRLIRAGRGDRSARGRRAGGAPDEVARWCTELSRAVRAGATLTAALRDSTPPDAAADALAGARLALDRGVGLVAALDQAAQQCAHDADLQLALTVVRACAEHGGPPGEPLDRAAATLRARAADLADRRTHSAQARLSGVVMTWLPVAMLGILLATSASVRAAVTVPPGVFVVVAGAALNAAGWRWMNRIIGGRR